MLALVLKLIWFLCRLATILLSVFVSPNLGISFFGKMLESKRNFGVNQWNFNQQASILNTCCEIDCRLDLTCVVLSAGSVSLQLPKWNELYQWNKVTTCVHNLFGGQRWVDQYGELRISCNTGVSCKLTFVKASYWSAKRHEVYGSICDADGKEVRNLFGKWSEALYCGVAPAARCIWRRGE